ncbi:hypothetical protein MRX96_007344 [Rhipicephalus microplus]
MYPPEGPCQYLYYTDVVIVGGAIRASLVQDSWRLFQAKASTYKKVKAGIAFDYRYISRVKIYSALPELQRLARQRMEHYGLLNVITEPDELNATVEAMRPVLKALKEIQSNDPNRKTVIAIGSLNYKSGGFDREYKQIIKNVVNTFNADAVIAISSVSAMESTDNCSAVPPNVLSSQSPDFPSLETHWPLVRSNAKYASGKTLVGLSFEMGTLLYVLESEAVSPRDAAYAKCKDFGITSRDAICGRRNRTDTGDQFLDEPYVLYGTFLDGDTRKYVAFAEYFTSCRDKFIRARRKYGSVRRRVAWMLFNVHLGDVRGRCGSGAFLVVKLICQEIRGSKKCG